MGILSSLHKSRVRATAEIKAAKKRAASEVKARHKAAERREKLLARQEKQLIKAEQKGLKARRKHEKKMAENQLAQLKAGRFNKDKVKRWAGAARLLTPLLIPVVYRAVTAGREQIEARRARRYGVTSEQLAQFSGYGASLKARIQGVRNSVKDAPLKSGFREDVDNRLDELATAVDNAEYMTPEQRRRAHDAIGRDLESLTDQVHAKLA